MTLRALNGRTAAPLLLALGLALGVGCQGQRSKDPPIVPIRNMHEVPRYDAQEPSPYFEDGRAMRPQIPHTVAREMVIDEAIDTGVDVDGDYVLTVPEEVVTGAGGMQPLAERGQGRYEIFCTPCHGGLGDGNGMVPEVSGVGTIRPPSFHDDRLRHAPDGQIYATIRNGIRNMPAYGANIPVTDRWAIVAYLRALQLNQAESPTASLDLDAAPEAAR
jgi:mono/diheme cytochrome c family protein